MDNEKKTKYKVAGQVLKANNDGSIRFRLITDGVDRDSEVLLPMGARLENWKANPVWLWSHNIETWGGMARPPIGKGNPETVEQTEHFLDLDVKFDENNDPFAKMIAAKHRDGFLTATSVGFIPITISSDTVKPDQKGVTHQEFEMLEGSSVPIPSNPEALQQNQWGGFVDDCKKYGFGNINMKVWMKMAGWTDEQIKDSLPNDNLTVVIPYDKTNVTATENYEISDVSDGKAPEEPESNDSEADVEVGQKRWEEFSKEPIVAKFKSDLVKDERLSSDEVDSAVMSAIIEFFEPLKEEKDNTYKLIIDKIEAINVFDKPDASTQILNTLKEIELS